MAAHLAERYAKVRFFPGLPNGVLAQATVVGLWHLLLGAIDNSKIRRFDVKIACNVLDRAVAVESIIKIRHFDDRDVPAAQPGGDTRRPAMTRR